MLNNRYYNVNERNIKFIEKITYDLLKQINAERKKDGLVLISNSNQSN